MIWRCDDVMMWRCSSSRTCWKKHIILFAIIFKFPNLQIGLSAQSYTTNYFRSPIDSPIYLSGNFCTLRNEHFHYGIDITTYEREGMPVLAAADGYVSRIKVWPYGYGKAIYIDHPNGFTTVYAHLNRFNDFVGKAVKDTQYKKESFEVEFFPEPGAWPVKKGELIAYSGNSGGSSGPHIHFEIRHTKTEEIINPLLFGLKVLDTIKPEIKNVALVHFDYGQPFIHKVFTDTLDSDTIDFPVGETGVEAIINDYTTFRAIIFNAYNIRLLINYSELVYNCAFERFPFDKAKQINKHIDYDTYWDYGLRYQKLWIDSGNTLGFYKSGIGNGKFMLDTGVILPVIIGAADVGYGNVEKTFYLRGIPDTFSWIKKERIVPPFRVGKIDFSPPTIKPTNINKKVKVKGDFINFEIKDKLSGIGSYRGTLDGKWVLMDYDAKNDWLTYIFDENTPKGKLLFHLVVKDKKDNMTVWKKVILIP
ncbi:MAG: M23 family metallopeptidase [Flavobacteriaceae bacterium]|nr:M23 family metallopeptidase [Flavobacteriaceae bacterium]